MSDEGQLSDLEPWTQERLERFVDAVFTTIAERLVDEPVEPRGILSRIEHHVVRLLETQGRIADHDTRVDTGRFEVIRGSLASMLKDVETIKATLQTILQAQEVYNSTLASLAAQMLKR